MSAFLFFSIDTRFARLIEMKWISFIARSFGILFGLLFVSSSQATTLNGLLGMNYSVNQLRDVSTVRLFSAPAFLVGAYRQIGGGYLGVVGSVSIIQAFRPEDLTRIEMGASASAIQYLSQKSLDGLFLRMDAGFGVAKGYETLASGDLAEVEKLIYPKFGIGFGHSFRVFEKTGIGSIGYTAMRRRSDGWSKSVDIGVGLIY